MSLTIQITWILFAHYVLDYPLQGEFLAITKGKNWYSLFAHSMIYSFGMGLVLHHIGHFWYGTLFILFISHFYIDFLKATAINKEKALTTYLYIDQALHILINLFLVFIH